MGAKEVVAEYYNSEAFRSAELMGRLIHDELVLEWHSSKGFLTLEKNDLLALGAELDKSYSASRVDIGHLIEENGIVSIRYTQYVNAFENPGEEMVLAHFVAFWEVKDDKLYKGWLMSQLQ